MNTIPIGLRNGDPTSQIIPPKIFQGPKRNIPEIIGRSKKVETHITEKTRNKHDYWFTYSKGDSKKLAAKVRYLSDQKGYINIAYLVTALGKSKITLDEKGELTSISFKPHVKFQQKPGGHPLILRAAINSLNLAVIVVGEKGIESARTEFPCEIKDIERFTLDDLTNLEGHGKWEKSTEAPNDPRKLYELPTLDYQLQVFLGHYVKARPHIRLMYNTFGAPRFN